MGRHQPCVRYIRVSTLLALSVTGELFENDIDEEWPKRGKWKYNATTITEIMIVK